MNKIANLFHCFPANVVLTSDLLAEKGYSPQLMQKYIKSGWVKRIGDGAYCRSNDVAQFQGALWAVQQKKQLSVCGKSALELQGHEHYLTFGKRTIHLACRPGFLPPKWFRAYDFDVDFKFVRSVEISNALLNEVMIDHIPVIMSCLELAALEACQGIPKMNTFDSIRDIFDGLTSLRVDILQTLLETFHSIKAKRLFLYFADQAKHAWFKKLDLNKVDLGVGKRQIVKGGKLDATYLITVPYTHFEG
jgi:hypothetical protein